MEHFQNSKPGCLDHLPLLWTGCVKAVDRGDILVAAKKINPILFTLLRHWDDSLQHYDGNTNYSVWLDRARHWFGTFIDRTFLDEFAPYIDGVSWHNEIWANSQNANERLERIIATEAALTVWEDEYRSDSRLSHIKLVVGEAPIGNWMPREIAELAIAYRALVGYHPYTAWGWDNKPRQRWEYDWENLSGLWDTMEHDWGLKPTWVFTECGPFSNNMNGWRSSEVCGGDVALYVEAVRQWILDVQRTPAFRENRIVGFNLFTTGGGDKWKNFETGTNELNEMAKMYTFEWQPGQGGDDGGDMNTWRDDAWDESVLRQTISLNAQAGLQRAIFLDGYVPVQSEFRMTFDGQAVALQAAEDLGGGPRRVYWVKVPEPGQPWGIPAWFTKPGSVEIVDIVTELETNEESQWYPYETRPLEYIDKLTVHHTVSVATPEQFAHFHCASKGWPGIGYHFVIEESGKVYQTNYLETVSYHSGAKDDPEGQYNNLWSVGIALVGDFRYKHPTEQQLASLFTLLHYLDEILPAVVEVLGHYEMPGCRTACPGYTWPEWRDRVISGSELR